MNFTLLRAIQGRLLTAYGMIMLIPLLLGIYDNDPAVPAFALTALVTIVLGLILWKKGHMKDQMGLREGFATVAGIWILASFIGAFPYYLSGYIPNYLDALFETTSGFTATGATILSDIEILPRSLLLWRSLSHWLGGMGIIVFFILLLPRMGMGAVHLFKAEITGPDKERVSPKIRQTAMLLWGIYSGLTISVIILLKLAGMPLFDAINHAFSCMATGGFSTKNASIGAYNSWLIELILIIFMTLSGINFTIYINTWRKGRINLIRNTELKVYLAIILLATSVVTLSLILQGGYEWSFALRGAAFQVVSVMTTTGFAITDFDIWPSLAKMLLFFLMFIGGCAASTSGGLKVARIVLLFKMGVVQIKQAIHPQLVTNVFSAGKVVDPLILRNVTRFFFLFILTFVCASTILAAVGFEPFDAMGAAIAALGNVGPGFGVVGPATTYASVLPLGKIVMIICMFLGRLELMTFLVLLQPDFWRNKSNW